MRGLPKVGILKAAAKTMRPRIILKSLLDKNFINRGNPNAFLKRIQRRLSRLIFEAIVTIITAHDFSTRLVLIKL